MGKASSKRRHKEDSPTVDQYFMKREAGTLQMRDEIVRRNELFGALEWFYAIQMLDNLPWYKRLWRWIRRRPPLVGAAAVLRNRALGRRDAMIEQIDHMVQVRKAMMAEAKKDDPDEEPEEESRIIHLGDRE